MNYRFKIPALFKATTIYSVTNILNMSLPFLLMPILTRCLQPKEYGIIAMFQLVIAAAAPIIGVSMNGAVSRRYYDRDEIRLDTYIGNCLIILLCNSLLGLLVISICRDYASKLTGIPSNWLWTIVAYSFCITIINIGMALYQVESKPFKYGILQLSQAVLNFALTLLLVVVFLYGWRGRLIAINLSLACIAAVILVLLYRNKFISFSFNRSYIRNILNFGVPLIPHALGAILLTQVDRYFISTYVSVEEVGIYSVAVQLTSMFTLLQQSFNNAYLPWVFRQLKEEDERAKVKIVSFTYGYFIFMVLAAILLYCSLKFLLPVWLVKSMSIR